MIFNEHCQFFTATILDWKPILYRDDFKDIIIDALRFRVLKEEVLIYGFVIMPNHIHVIWHITDKVIKADFQRDFLNFISKQFILKWKEEGNEIIEEFVVNKIDRTIQIWKRDSLSMDLYSMLSESRFQI